jgi:hypothetical protein
VARIALGAYAFRYPLGGNLAWTLHWALGLRRLGHDVLLLEKGDYPSACFDPVAMQTGDDCSAGLRAVTPLLRRFGLEGSFCFVDRAGTYFGWQRREVQEYMRSADLLIDLGTHGSWLAEADTGSCMTVLVDGEPGYTQMRRELKQAQGLRAGSYDRYFTNGANLPTGKYSGPTAGLEWAAVFNPVVSDLYSGTAPPRAGAITTVMNWQSHDALSYQGRTWGQKDVEFTKFIGLPRATGLHFEVAVAGGATPVPRLEAAGWRVKSAIMETRSYPSFVKYIINSAAEFSVCKEAYVSLATGWFSDRSATYLAAGRPVVMQDTGFGAYLPVGVGLFAVRDQWEAAAALADIMSDLQRHSEAARAIANEHLDARVILPKFLAACGL